MNPQETDLIVVGSGAAGLTAALTGARQNARVLLITAGSLSTGSSWWAQGGVAAAVGADDRPAYHAADTVAVGAGLNDRNAVNVLVRDGRRAINDLIAAGVPFDGGPEHPDLTLEAGHGHRRILHANGGATGEALSNALLQGVLKTEAISTLAETPVERLLTENGRVRGVVAGGKTILAKAVILTTGGYGGLWERSTNPPGNNGGGLCMAWQAGATLADLEFVQFHPTALAVPGLPSFLLSEALRGEGAQLVNKDEEAVVNPLLPRDVVARAIFRYTREHGTVYISLRHLDPDFVHERFAAISNPLRGWGIDLARDLVPVAPAAHYCMGGIRTDTSGRSDVSGLYAAGEVACTGVQGANRLASNSLLECLVFGRRAVLAALADTEKHTPRWHTVPLVDASRQITAETVEADPWLLTAPVWTSATIEQLPCAGPYTNSYPLTSALWRDLGVERNAEGMRRLMAELPEPGDCGGNSGFLVAGLATRAALLRTESRGAHYRSDYPDTDPAWKGRILWRRDMAPRFEEVYS